MNELRGLEVRNLEVPSSRNDISVDISDPIHMFWMSVWLNEINLVSAYQNN